MLVLISRMEGEVPLPRSVSLRTEFAECYWYFSKRKLKTSNDVSAEKIQSFLMV